MSKYNENFIQREFVVKQVVKIAISTDHEDPGEAVDSNLDLCSAVANLTTLNMDGVEDALHRVLSGNTLSIGTEVTVHNVHDVTDENVEDYL